MAFAGTLTVVRIEELLAQTNRLRRHLTQLVFLDEFQSLLQGEADRRNQGDGFASYSVYRPNRSGQPMMVFGRGVA
ncbi:hypothetical protein FQZ97_902670 [compost metagenome]